MSKSRYGFPPFISTGCDVEPESLHHQTKGLASAFARQRSSPASASPNQNLVCVPPRAALSHSASVGSRSFPAPTCPVAVRCAFSFAMKPPVPPMSSHETQYTG